MYAAEAGEINKCLRKLLEYVIGEAYEKYTSDTLTKKVGREVQSIKNPV